MLSIHSYIKKHKSFIFNNQVYFWVLGNESADADSIISSIVYAYFLTVHTSNLHIPIINCGRNNLLHKNELVVLFRETKIASGDFMCIEDINIDDIISEKHKNIILVDHNIPSPSQQLFSHSIDHIIDHHHNEDLSGVSTKIIIPAGSCATLVANEIYSTLPRLVDRTVATLLLAPILLDTSNLSNETGRTTNLDCSIVKRLLDTSCLDQQKFYSKLIDAKNSTDHMTLIELLALDYKQWQTSKISYGISSIPIAIEDLIKRDDLFSGVIADFASNKGLDLLICMLNYNQNGLRREMIIYYPDQDDTKKMIAWLNNHRAKLTNHIKHSAVNGLVMLKQHNTSLSRKLMQPLIDTFLTQ